MRIRHDQTDSVLASLRKSRGFTVFELMVTICILGLLARYAVEMTFQTLSSGNKNTARILLVQELRRAQAMAVTEGCRGIWSLGNSGNTYSFGCDYIPYDTNTTPAADVAKFAGSFPAGMTMSVSSQLIYNTRGQLVDASNALVTRTVTLSAGGSSFASGTIRATGFFSYN